MTDEETLLRQQLTEEVIKKVTETYFVVRRDVLKAYILSSCVFGSISLTLILVAFGYTEYKAALKAADDTINLWASKNETTVKLNDALTKVDVDARSVHAAMAASQADKNDADQILEQMRTNRVARLQAEVDKVSNEAAKAADLIKLSDEVKTDEGNFVSQKRPIKLRNLKVGTFIDLLKDRVVYNLPRDDASPAQSWVIESAPQ